MVAFMVLTGVLGMAAYHLVGTPDDALSGIFLLEGVFDESEGIVTVSYLDRTGNTTYVILEVLGMDESYQRRYNSSEFTETIEFHGKPKYGWKAHPVTLLIQHDDLGTIRAKTEIRNEGEEIPAVIFGR